MYLTISERDFIVANTATRLCLWTMDSGWEYSEKGYCEEAQWDAKCSPFGSCFSGVCLVSDPRRIGRFTNATNKLRAYKALLEITHRKHKAENWKCFPSHLQAAKPTLGFSSGGCNANFMPASHQSLKIKEKFPPSSLAKDGARHQHWKSMTEVVLGYSSSSLTNKRNY